MDAAEQDRDVLLQRSSAEILEDFTTSLTPFLWKNFAGKTNIRLRVRTRETSRLVQLLERFQELPQLLDPHLQTLIPTLSDAFLAYLQATQHSRHTTKDTNLLCPLSRAICRLLYTFCKIRGEKVIVRFLSTETRYLELLVSAIEGGTLPHEEGSLKHVTWEWEERYIALLWLSQLLLAPFDLASISSSGPADESIIEIQGLNWPENVPGIALRLIPIGIHYLASPGKEREGAKALLVRIAMRRDMQELGILDALVRWAISMFEPVHNPMRPVQYYIGLLSLLGGILGASSGTSDMDNYLGVIVDLIEQIQIVRRPISDVINNSAVCRKLLIKISRSVSVLDLRNGSLDQTAAFITTLLEYLGDSATPVRLAASKAFSVITLKLPEEMALQVVNMVVDQLDDDIRWKTVGAPGDAKYTKTAELTRCNPEKWHGLMLTLAHFLYRHVVPVDENLGNILTYLVVGLSFEQRSTLGSSIGSNIRDAACYGIWSLARRYSTDELQALSFGTGPLSWVFTIPSSRLESPKAAILQGLATELVVSACLDPAGNIRRGSSAALQELVGRHPDAVIEGIQLVQIVDYHAIARGSRAILEVATQAAQLHENYFDALASAMLGWRGVRDTNAVVRRTIAIGYADLFSKKRHDKRVEDFDEMQEAISQLFNKYTELSPLEEPDEAHGILLCACELIEGLRSTLDGVGIKSALSDPKKELRRLVGIILTQARYLLENTGKFSTTKVTELLAESTSFFIFVLCPVLRADMAFRWCSNASDEQIAQSLDLDWIPWCNTPVWTSGEIAFDPHKYMEFLQEAQGEGISPDRVVMSCINLLFFKFMEAKANETTDIVSHAIANFLLLSTRDERANIIENSINCVNNITEGKRGGEGKSHILLLFKVWAMAAEEPYKLNKPGLQSNIMAAIEKRWVQADIEAKCTILNALSKSSALFTDTNRFEDIINGGLENFTQDNRGDVGSLVRIEALKVVEALGMTFASGPDEKLRLEEYRGFRLRYTMLMMALSAEKLDKVRIAALGAMVASNKREFAGFEKLDPSSKEYFLCLLESPRHTYLKGQPYDVQWLIAILLGYVTSAGFGSSDIINASRAALVEFCEDETENADVVALGLFEVLKKFILEDRILVPTLEVIGFLFDMNIIQGTSLSTNWRPLFILIQKSHYKSNSIPKLYAAVKIYGGLIEVYPEALKKLTSMLLHPFPKVANAVSDELYARRGVAGGVDWGYGTELKKGEVERVRRELGVE